jgi:aldehyde dehydrogenase (NAD+)
MHPVLTALGLDRHARVKPAAGPAPEGWVVTENPADGSPLAMVRLQPRAELEATIARAQKAFESWRMLPAPKRGEIVRRIGEAFRVHKDALGELVSL